MVSNGQRPARTAQDVAQLEADNEYLHNENERISRELAVVTADRSRLQIENAMLGGRATEHLVKATRMETIVRQLSAGLVAALQEITQERVTERAVRRQIQEEHLIEETGPAPTFLTRGTNRTRPLEEDRHDSGGMVEAEGGEQHDKTAAAERDAVQPEARRESDQDREDRLRGAAERLHRPPVPRTPRIDHTLAARDPRMPGAPEYGGNDDDSLRRLAGDMNTTTRG